MIELNSKEKLYSDMISILDFVDANKDIPELDQSGMFALKQCVDDCLITGVVTETMISGRIVAEVTAPRVTKLGLEFLFPNKLEPVQNEQKPEEANLEANQKSEASKLDKHVLFWTIVGAIAAVVFGLFMVLTHFEIL